MSRKFLFLQLMNKGQFKKNNNANQSLSFFVSLLFLIEITIKDKTGPGNYYQHLNKVFEMFNIYQEFFTSRKDRYSKCFFFLSVFSQDHVRESSLADFFTSESSKNQLLL